MQVFCSLSQPLGSSASFFRPDFSCDDEVGGGEGEECSFCRGGGGECPGERYCACPFEGPASVGDLLRMGDFDLMSLVGARDVLDFVFDFRGERDRGDELW